MPGPWSGWTDVSGGDPFVTFDGGVIAFVHESGMPAANTDFIAHARNDVPYLLARLSKCEASLRSESRS